MRFIRLSGINRSMMRAMQSAMKIKRTAANGLSTEAIIQVMSTL